MPTELKRNVFRKTTARVFSSGQNRNVILGLIAPAKVGVRLEGTRQTYKIDAEAVFMVAVKLHVAEIEKAAKRIAKNEGLKIRSARAKATKELAAELKV